MGRNQEHSSQGRRSRDFTVKKVLMLPMRAFLMVLCFLLYMGVIPIFFVFMTPLYLYRYLVILAQKLLKPDWVGMMSTRDALVGLDNTSSHCECMITLLLTIKGEPKMDLIHQVFQKEVLEARNGKGELSYLKLMHYFETWMGFTFWKNEESFSLAKHVREYDVTDFDDPNNNSDIITEDQLMKGLGSIATKPFPKGMSPWEALIIRKYKKAPSKLHTDFKQTVPIAQVNTESEKDIEFAVILRIHHAIGDGYSIMKLLMANICGGSLSVVPKAPVRRVSPYMKLLNYIAIVFLTPYYHFLQFFFNVDRTVWHLPSHQLTKKWQFTMTERISFTRVKNTSKRLGVCVTATLIAGLAGGIHNFLKKKGKSSRNTREMRGLSPLPWSDHPMDTLVNHWTVGIFDIPVHKSCPRKRLLAAHKNVEGLKRSPILVTNFMTVPILLGAPNWLTNFWGTNWMTTMIISNFPGPNFPGIAFYNTQHIDDVVSWVPHMRGSAGLGVMFLSYNGGVRVSLSVDKAIIKDQDELNDLSDFIAQEFLSLSDLGSLQPNTEAVV